MIIKAASALGRSLMLGEIDIYARFAVLFAVAVASVVAFYMSVIVTVGILAEEAGAVGAHSEWPSYAALAIVGMPLDKLPPAAAYEAAVFPTLEDQAAAKEVITKNWDSVVGANVQ